MPTENAGNHSIEQFPLMILYSILSIIVLNFEYNLILSGRWGGNWRLEYFFTDFELYPQEKQDGNKKCEAFQPRTLIS